MSTILVCTLVAVAHVTHPAPGGKGSCVVVVAATWEEAEARLGVKPHAIIISGPLSDANITKFYSGAGGVTMWRDSSTDLIIGISDRQPVPARSERDERAAARFRELFGKPEATHTAPMPREVNR